MSATTNLKFTLSSGTVVPDTPTTQTTTGTTYITAPNTGDNTSAGNAGSTAFATLFIIIGFAALAIFLAKYLKDNRRRSFAEKGSFHLSIRPRVFATVGLALAIAFLGSSILVHNYSENERRADAASTELGVSVTSDMTFSASRGSSAVLSDNVIVTTGGVGYALQVSTDNSKFCRENDTTNCLDSTTGDITSSDVSKLSALSTNQWGMSLSGADATANIWGAVPTSAKTIKSVDSTAANTDTTKVYYGVNVGSDLPDGTYYGKVIYTAYTDAVGDYKVTTINGYVGKDGTKTTNRFNDGVTVFIRPDCPATTTFKGWTSDVLSSTAITGPTGDNLYQFTMPAKDVVVTAVCESEPEAALIIKYDANAPTGTTATGTTADTNVTDPTDITLASNGFAITDYIFQGWACSKSATAYDFTAGAKIKESDLTAKGCQKTTLEEGPAEYKLYAIWKKNISEPTYLQDVTAEYCDNMALFQVVTLKDKRYGADNQQKEYSFTKYADGRCWMLQDLAYVPKKEEMTTDLTDLTSNVSLEFKTSGNASSDALYHTQSGYSTLYNYKAATAGYWNSSITKDTNIPDSLCPASWKIPDASHGPYWPNNIVDPNGSPTVEVQFGNQSGELYGLWMANIGKANGGGESAPNTSSSSFSKQGFFFGNGTFTTPVNNLTANYVHFTYNGAWNFSTGTWADTDKGTSGKYASYFLSTTTTKDPSDSTVVPAAFNPHAPGVDTDTADINSTDPAHGSAIRCVLRTAEQRTDRSYPTGWRDITTNN